MRFIQKCKMLAWCSTLCNEMHYYICVLFKEKCIAVYNKFISELCIYAKGYLPISLITPYKLQEIINLVTETLIKKVTQIMI